MSDRAGDFVSPPKALTYADVRHLAKPGVRVPVSAILKMAGRPVRGLVMAPIRVEPAPTAIAAPDAPPVRDGLSSRVRTLLNEIAARHGGTLAELRSRAKPGLLAAARLEAYYELSQLKGPTGDKAFSWLQVARFLHRDDHTTALKGAKAHLKRMAAK